MSEFEQGIFQAQIYPTGFLARTNTQGNRYWVVSAFDVNQNPISLTAFQHSAIAHLEKNKWGQVFIKAKPDNKGGQYLNIVHDPSTQPQQSQQQLPMGQDKPPQTQAPPPPPPPAQNTGAIPPANNPSTPPPPAPTPQTAQADDVSLEQVLRGMAVLGASMVVSGDETVREMFNLVQAFDFDTLCQEFFNKIKTGKFQDDPFETSGDQAEE